MARDVKFFFKSYIKRRRRKRQKKEQTPTRERDSKREIKMIIHKTMGLSNGLAAAYEIEKKRLKVKKKKKNKKMRERDMKGQEDNVLQDIPPFSYATRKM